MQAKHFVSNLGNLAGQVRERARQAEERLVVLGHLEAARRALNDMHCDSAAWRKAYAAVIDTQEAVRRLGYGGTHE